MRLGRHLAAAALAGPLALSLVAATAPSTGPTGTASTSLSAVDLTVTSPLGDGTLGLVDATTFASTATDTAVNAAGAPFASALLTPLTGPTGPIGQAEARSDGQSQVDVTGTTLEGIGGPVAALSGTVSPVTLTATAAADRAQAAVGTLTAEIAGLAEALGVQVNLAGVASDVTSAGATATQGLTVSEVEIALGDIIPADVLASLPLPDLLALLEALPVDLPTDVQALIDTLRQAIDELVAQLGALTGTGDDVAAALSELEELTDALGALQTLTAQREALLDVDLSDPLAGDTLTGIGGAIDGAVGGLTGGLEDTVDTVTDPVGDIVDGGGGLLGLSNHTTSCVTAGSITTPDQLQDAVDCVGDLIAAELDALGVGSLTELQTLIDTVVTEVTTLVDQLVETIEGLVPLLGELTTASLDLGDILGQLTSLLPDVAGTPLVSVSAFDLGINSASDGTVEGSSATVLCQPVTVTILGQALSTPSCEEGLAAVSDAAAAVNGLLGSLTGTLNTLPVADVISTGDIRVDLFTDLTRSVVEEGDAVTATAGVTALDLELPSITIDPAPVTGLLGDLGLPDILGTVEALLADTLAQVNDLGLAALGTVSTTLSDAEAQLGVDGGLGDLVAELEGILAGLDLGQLGTLDSFSTPSVALVIDPVSTASFAPGAEAPAGAPEPTTPSLPNTGGGLALLGLASLAGAYGLRRRS